MLCCFVPSPRGRKLSGSLCVDGVEDNTRRGLGIAGDNNHAIADEQELALVFVFEPGERFDGLLEGQKTYTVTGDLADFLRLSRSAPNGS